MYESELTMDIIKCVASYGQVVPPGFIDDIAKCAYYGMHKARDICDYCGVTALELLSCLLQVPEAVRVYKKKKSQLKLDLMTNVIEAANSREDNSVTACKFLLGSLFKESENAAAIAQSKTASDMRLTTERERLKLSKKALQFSKDSFLVNLVANNDKQTIDKIKSLLHKHFMNAED